jgi:hypothetical protein
MQQVEIHIRGQIDPEWSEWFEGFSIQEEGANLTVLRGEIIDQTALYALLNRLSRLGIELTSIDIRLMGSDR